MIPGRVAAWVVARKAVSTLELATLSNKPMVPTAAASPAVSPPHPLRRHIGRPLGSENAVVFILLGLPMSLGLEDATAGLPVQSVHTCERIARARCCVSARSAFTPQQAYGTIYAGGVGARAVSER